MTLEITINGSDISAILTSISITKDLNGRSSQASFNMHINPATDPTPSNEQEVLIYNAGTGAKVFRGFITSITIDQKSVDLQIWQIACIGVEYLLSNVTINHNWTSLSTDKDRGILNTAFTTALPEITTTNATVSQLTSFLQINAKDLKLVDLVNQVAAISGADWRVTEDKALLYYASGSIYAPFGFSDEPNF